MGSHHKKKVLSRRAFLEAGLFSSAGVAAMSPLQLTAVTFMQGLMRDAFAQTSGISRNYILLMIDQGIMKSLFDLPLRPNGNDQYVHNPMSLTKLVNPSDPNNFGKYEHTKIGNYYLPYLWSGTVPHSSGAQRPIAELAENAMMIRGVDTGSNSHGASKNAQNRPSQAKGSLTGLNADNSNKPFPSIHNGSSWNYYSEKGVTSIPYSDLNQLIKPFTGLNSPITFGDPKASKDMANNMMSIIKDLKRNQSLKSRSYFDDSENAKKLFLTSFGDLTAIYNQLHDKYEDLVKRSLREHNLTGFDKEPIISKDMPHFRIGTNTVIQPDTDLRDTIVYNEVTQGQEQRSVPGHKDSTITGLARGFAVAEYMLLNNLASSITINGSQQISNTYQRRLKDGSVSTTETNEPHGLDAHFVGAIPTMFFHGKYQKAVAACMLEFFDKLKAGGVYDNTVLNLCTDFHRCGIEQAYGSDHGNIGSALSLFGGLINGLQVGGNILVNGTGGRGSSNRYLGSWGQGANIQMVGGRPLVVGNAASTLASILGVNTPKVNDNSLATMDSNKASLILSELKNIA